MRTPGRLLSLILLLASCTLNVPLPAAGQTEGQKPDITRLSQEFIDPHSTAPWIFTPQDNIKQVDTTEHPGYVTIWEAGKGKDIKGILDKPINLDDYPLPWEFHLGLLQNAQAIKGLSEKQINYAFGLNLAVTFSDPSTWPKDRNELPPDTHSLQVFVVHLGSYGEVYRPGIPGVRDSALNYHDPAPEVYLVYQRGDLAPEGNGNWNIPYIWVGPEVHPGQIISGSFSKEGGPADFPVRFRVRMASRHQIEIGFGYGLHPAWRMRSIDTSKFGRMTGVWEIGPIISLDRWIPDVLPKELGIGYPPYWLDSLEGRYKWLKQPDEQEALAAVDRMKSFFKVDPPDPTFEYYVDYAVFYEDNPQNLEDLSTDFNIPGFIADRKWYQEGNAITETFSHPGHLTVTEYGNNGGWAMCPVGTGQLDLSGFKPPWEIEIAFTAPDDNQPWNIWLTPTLSDEHGKVLGQGWNPGVQNIPGKGRSFINSFQDPTVFGKSNTLNIEFEKPVPQAILTHKPLYMLIQILDDSHLRVGFRADKKDPWYYSKTFDTTTAFGKIGKLQTPCFASFQGMPGKLGWGVGNYPSYQQFLIDYIHFRSGASAGH